MIVVHALLGSVFLPQRPKNPPPPSLPAPAVVTFSDDDYTYLEPVAPEPPRRARDSHDEPLVRLAIPVPADAEQFFGQSGFTFFVR